MTTPQLSELVKEWREIYEERKELEKLAEELKDGPEAQAAAALIDYLHITGQQAARLPNGGGTVSLKKTTSVWLADATLACQVQYDQFKTADAEGRPLMDELLFQQRPLKNLVLKMAEEKLAADGIPIDFNSLNTALAPFGFRAIETESLSYTKK